jgi:DNA ligase D-like protein (predicted polymerase)/DNA ligase D-like protein (predicted 3'-phosphoesterase)
VSLEEYKQKRDFGKTPEPPESLPGPEGPLRFVVQRHEASTLHYDFRLELEGVLKSWAVPKGPSLNPADKRLAVQVEDHPYAYRTFEGDIPEGQYGAGRVTIWDEGTYHAPGTEDRRESERVLLEGLQKGRFSFVLEGKKLSGEFSLVQMKGRQEGAWLLRKKEDDHALTGLYDSEDHLSPGTARKKAPVKAKAARAAAKPKPAPATSVRKAGKGTSSLHLTNLDKVYWPEEGYTKGDLINYYKTVGKYILPYLTDRPESLLRHPNGIAGQSFYQKNAGEQAPDWVETITVRSESTGEDVHYIICQDQTTLSYLNNLGCIQLNPWNSRTPSLYTPDYLVLDLDPGENTFEEVIEVAQVTKEVLDQAGAASFCKTSGATGLHVYVPLGARYPFEQAKAFAHQAAKQVHERLPTLTSLERSPKERRRQVYLDFLQNAFSQTLAAPYSVRPRPRATVSAPLRWEEVKPGLHPSQFTIQTMPGRLKQEGDLFKGVLGEGVDLEEGRKRLEGTV